MDVEQGSVKHSNQPGSRADQIDDIACALIGSWELACSQFLPEISPNSRWRYSRKSTTADPDQGWKLHLSANVLNAVEVLERVGPFLCSGGVLFKAPVSLHELSRINSGLHYGYGQVGKFITVYPQSAEQAVSLANTLHKLTSGLSTPAVPFDEEFRPGGCVYYRYGAFKRFEIENPDGSRSLALRSPRGDMIPDSRETATPDWVANPFPTRPVRSESMAPESPLKTTVRVFRALSQRGKGGVYHAIDLSTGTPRFCILKEGRAGGEIGWDGRDGFWRVRNEERALRSLAAAGIKSPQFYSSFEVEDNYYLVTEFIEGETLHALLAKRTRRMTVRQTLKYAIKICGIVHQIHNAGWIWRDCKPSNLIVSRKGELRPLDFEGACPIDQPDPSTWRSPGFSAREPQDVSPRRRALQDVYSIGAIAYFLLTGSLPAEQNPKPISNLRARVPSTVCEIVSDLMSADPRRRPTAKSAARRFEAALRPIDRSRVSGLGARARLTGARTG